MNEYVNNDVITKRKVLCCIATIFDLPGLVGPTIVPAKIIMPNLLQTKLGWDERLPTEICQTWEKYRQNSPLSNNVYDR